MNRTSWWMWQLLASLALVQSLSRVQLFVNPWTAACRFFPVLHCLPEFAQTHMPSNHLILCRFLLFLPSILPSIRIFSNEFALRIKWPKSWSFSISSSSEYPGLISFKINCFGLCCPRNSQESSPAPQFGSINSSALSLFYCPALTSVHVYRKSHSFDYKDLCWQNNVSDF